MKEDEFDISKVERLDKTSELGSMLARWEAKKAKKNFRNWFNGLFSDEGYAGYAPYYLLLHPWEILLYWKREVVWAWQRVFRGWDERATWSADVYFAKQIVEIVGELRKIDFGIPMYMFNGFPTEDESDWEYSKETEEEVHQLWLKELDEIVVGFKSYLEDSDKNISDKNTDESYVRAFDLLRKHFKGLWW